MLKDDHKEKSTEFYYWKISQDAELNQVMRHTGKDPL